jgi:hypothetical protein
MQDPNPLPWGALDRYQAHFIVRRVVKENDLDFVAKTVLKTKGHFGSKKVEQANWNGGKLAEILNSDSALNDLIKKQNVKDASIFVEPTSKGIRIHGKWKNHLDFGISKELFEIYDKIAGHIKSL